MPALLLVHHTPSPSVHDMRLAIADGTAADGLEEVELHTAAALGCGPADVLAADAVVLCGPANLGSMAGALKHFFDVVYYPCLDETRGLPFGVALHGNDDVDGARRDIDRIVTGLGWTRVTDDVRVVGGVDADDRDALWNLGATVAASTLR